MRSLTLIGRGIVQVPTPLQNVQNGGDGRSMSSVYSFWYKYKASENLTFILNRSVILSSICVVVVAVFGWVPWKSKTRVEVSICQRKWLLVDLTTSGFIVRESPRRAVNTGPWNVFLKKNRKIRRPVRLNIFQKRIYRVSCDIIEGFTELSKEHAPRCKTAIRWVCCFEQHFLVYSHFVKLIRFCSSIRTEMFNCQWVW